MISLPVECQKFYFWCSYVFFVRRVWRIFDVLVVVQFDVQQTQTGSQAHFRNQLQVEGGLTEVFQTELRFWTTTSLTVRPGTQSDSGCQRLARVDSQSRSAWSPPETRGSRAAPHSVLWSRIWRFRPAEKPDPVQKLFQNKSLFSVWKKRTCESVELLSDFTLET